MGKLLSKRCSQELQPPPDADERLKIRKVLTTISVSNPSLADVVELGAERETHEAQEMFEGEGDEGEAGPAGVDKKVTMDDDGYEFTTEVMKELAQKYAEDNKITTDAIPPAVVKQMSSVLDTIANEDHILLFCTRFHDMLANKDELMTSLFAQYTEGDVVLTYCRQVSMENRHLMHSMYVLRIHKLIIQALEEGTPEKAYEILKYVALSHIIMKIPPEQFRVQAVQLIKFFQSMNLIGDEHMELLSYYFHTCITHIIAQMTIFRREVPDLDDVGEVNDLAREHYRELRKWKVIANSIRTSLNKPLTQLDREQVECKRQGINVAAPIVVDLDTETWKINRCLRKGYKHRFEYKFLDTVNFCAKKKKDVQLQQEKGIKRKKEKTPKKKKEKK